MFRSYTYFWLIYATFILTSNISNATKNKINDNTFEKLTSFIYMKDEYFNDNKSVTIQPIITEGGSINASLNSMLILEGNESQKPPLKIVPRKGANIPANLTIETSKQVKNSSTLYNNSQTTQQINLNITKPNNKNKIEMPKVSTEPKTKQIEKSENVANKIKAETKSVVNTTNKIVFVNTTRKPKHKPTKTVGDSEDDKPIRSSPTGFKNGRKIDYIVPVILIISGIPMLGAVLYVFYKKGRDCWEKRHYRRMDFLIDGMYNE